MIIMKWEDFVNGDQLKFTKEYKNCPEIKNRYSSEIVNYILQSGLLLIVSIETCGINRVHIGFSGYSGYWCVDKLTGIDYNLFDYADAPPTFEIGELAEDNKDGEIQCHLTEK